jgi:hypothetical protein
MQINYKESSGIHQQRRRGNGHRSLSPDRKDSTGRFIDASEPVYIIAQLLNIGKSMQLHKYNYLYLINT